MEKIQREDCTNCAKTLVGVAGSQMACPVCKTPHVFSRADTDEELVEFKPVARPSDPVVVKRRK